MAVEPAADEFEADFMTRCVIDKNIMAVYADDDDRQDACQAIWDDVAEDATPNTARLGRKLLRALQTLSASLRWRSA